MRLLLRHRERSSKRPLFLLLIYLRALMALSVLDMDCVPESCGE